MPAESPVTVADVMSTPIETISKDATVREAATRMDEDDINGLFVPGASAGIITTTDIVAAVAAGEDLTALSVTDVMTAPVERITTREQLSQAAAMMTTYGIKHLPVVDTDGDYVGMVSSTDLTSHLA